MKKFIVEYWLYCEDSHHTQAQAEHAAKELRKDDNKKDVRVYELVEKLIQSPSL